jgi:hypothetical protein
VPNSRQISDISGQDNVVADALSHVESVTAPLSHDEIAATQGNDDDIWTLLASNTALWLERLQVPGTAVSLYCDISTGKPRPYVPTPLPENLGRMSLLLYASACSSPFMICLIPALSPRHSWSLSGLYGPASRRIAVPGQELASVCLPSPVALRTVGSRNCRRVGRAPTLCSNLSMLLKQTLLCNIFLFH